MAEINAAYVWTADRHIGAYFWHRRSRGAVAWVRRAMLAFFVLYAADYEAARTLVEAHVSQIVKIR